MLRVHSSAARRPRAAGIVAAMVALLAVSLFGAFWSPGGAASVPSGVTVTTSATTGLIDGAKVTITVKAQPDIVINQMIVKQCKLDATYETADDIEFYNGKCGAGPVSSSANSTVIRDQEGFFVLSRQPAGLEVPFKVGVGTSEWTIPGVGPRSFTCGPTDPCALVVRLRISGKAYYFTTRLDFVESDPLAACGGADPARLSSAGSDEVSDAWATWTRKFCATAAGSSGAPTTASFGAGEGPAVSGFSSGLNDIAYTAAGYDTDVAFNPRGAPTRPSVAVPIALNAAVMATGSGGLQTVNGLPIGKASYPTLELTASEVAAFVSGGLYWADRADQPFKAAIFGRNPELDNLMYYSGGAVDSAGVYAQSLPLSSVYYLTSFLKARAPDQFIVPGSTPVTPRVPAANFAQATPAYSDELKLVSGRPALRRVTEAAALNQNVPGPVWTVTDLANAKALELGLVAIETAPGKFVEPNPETMRAAVSSMKRDAQGLLQPDPKAPTTTAVSAQAGDAYPLTYVIYALVPAEPLYDETCQPRTKSQALLSEWLKFLTTDGQQNLPGGLVALTPELLADAKAEIAKIGASPATGTCAPRPVAAANAPSGGSAPPNAPSFAAPRIPTAGAVPGAVPAASAAGAGAATTETLDAIPAFAGRRIADATGGVVALVGIALVSSLGLFLTARALTGGGGGGSLGGEGGFVALGDRRSAVGLVALWLGVAIAGVMLVMYQLGPMLQQREQRTLFTEYRTELRAAAFASEGLQRGGDASALRPPEVGAPVAIVEIGDLQAQEVVVEGIGPLETAAAPGHVPGTAGIGQPGNSVVVGRRNAYGGPFGSLDAVRRGDTVVVTTTQGQSVYVVERIQERPLNRRLFAPTDDDRLTLVTSASSSPMNSDQATVVTASLSGLPFEPTVQGAPTEAQTSIDPAGGWSAVVLALTLYIGVLAVSLFAYRRFRFPVAYILTIAPILAVTVLLAESLSGLLPSWA